jgi:hypothetical protein
MSFQAVAALTLCIWYDGSHGASSVSYDGVQAINMTDAVKKVHIVFMNHLGNSSYFL